MGASFGAVAALSTASRHPDTYGSLLLQSGSFVFTDIGSEHGGGPVFDPVVRFTNRYRARPRAVADRVFVSCGVYEPLIVPNRSMVPVFTDTGMRVRYVESGTATPGRTGGTGSGTACPGSTRGRGSTCTSRKRLPASALSYGRARRGCVGGGPDVRVGRPGGRCAREVS